jgi:hypothetical protein
VAVDPTNRSPSSLSSARNTNSAKKPTVDERPALIIPPPPEPLYLIRRLLDNFYTLIPVTPDCFTALHCTGQSKFDSQFQLVGPAYCTALHCAALHCQESSRCIESWRGGSKEERQNPPLSSLKARKLEKDQLFVFVVLP